jgi:membrane associated rhomboid family serine protease
VLTTAGDETSRFIVFTFGFVPSHYSGAAPHSLLDYAGLAWPFVTHGFVHGNWIHLTFNAVFLMAFATPLVRRLGTPTFLVFYFLCGAFAAGAHLFVHFGSTNPVVGASGAISGCMAAALRVILSGTARYFLKDPGMGRLAPLLDRRLVLVTLVWVATNWVMGSGLLPIPGAEGAGIAWEAHIGGYFAGLLLIPLFDRLAGGSTRAYPTY